MHARRSFVMFCACITACASGCAESPRCEQPRSSPPLTHVADGKFWSRTTSFVPRGINSYPLLDHAGRGRDDLVGEIFQQAITLGRPVVRTGAHMIGGDHPGRLRNDDGSINEKGLAKLDRVVELAEQHGVQLVLITSNHWASYGGAPAVLRAVAPDEELPIDAFYSDARAIAHQREYLRALVTRINTRTGRAYASDSTIFAWELTNEARCTSCDDDALTRWSRTMARALRDAGATQPIAWGGQGFFDEHGEDIERIATVDEIDVLTVHLYPDHHGAQTFEPGAGLDRIPSAARIGAAWIRRAAELAVDHDKALLIEEAGWRTESASSDDERAIVLGAWARVASEVGAGFFPWMIAERDRVDYDGYLIRPENEPKTAAVLRCE